MLKQLDLWIGPIQLTVIHTIAHLPTALPPPKKKKKKEIE